MSIRNTFHNSPLRLKDRDFFFRFLHLAPSHSTLGRLLAGDCVALFTSSWHTTTMHPLVRDLWKRVVWVGRDYPTGLDHVKAVWKSALRNPENCPSWYTNGGGDEEELLRAVHKGRQAVKEMIGVIQLKKYRSLKQRYDQPNQHEDADSIMARLERQGGSKATNKATTVPRGGRKDSNEKTKGSSTMFGWYGKTHYVFT